MDAVTEQPVTTDQVARNRPLLPSRRTILASGIALVAVAAGAVWILSAPSSESTDDAYIAADVTSVAPKVRGLIAQVYVRDNQAVLAGQRLAFIDPEEFDARVAAAQGFLADAQAGVSAAKAALTSLDAEEKLAAAEVVAAHTSIRAANAESDKADADRRRYAALVMSGAVARSEVDRYAAAAVTAEQDAARTEAMLAVSQQTAAVTKARRPSLLAGLQTATAKVGEAQAALDLARQDRRHAIILAPVEGTIGNRQIRVGDYVQPGTRLLTLVPLDALYIEANFKETQTARMRVGQVVTVEADALPHDRFQGRIESFAPGSGSSFSLLPFEPGTGNFTKIVQRVAVRIRFDPGQPDIKRLRPGLSVTAKVLLND